MGHIPIDVITVPGKRGEGELGHMVEDYFKTLEKSEPDLKEPPSPSLATSSSETGVSGDTQSHAQWSQSQEGEGEWHDVPLDSPPSESSGYGLDQELKSANWYGPLPKLPSNANPDTYPVPLTSSKYGINLLHPPPARPGLQKELPNPNPMSSTDSKYGINLKHPPPARPASQSEIVKVPESQAEHIQQPKPGPSTDSDFDWDHWTKKVNQPPPKPGPSADSDFDWDHWTKVVNQPQPEPVSLKSSTSTKSRLGWKHWVNPLNLMDPMKPGAIPPKPKPSKPSADSGVTWKHWVNPLNLMDPMKPGAIPSKPKLSNPSTDSGVTWKYWLNPLNLMDPLVPGARLESSKSLSPKPSGAGQSIAGPSKPWTPPPIQPPKGIKIGLPPDPESPPPELNLEPLKRPVNEVVPGPPPTPDSELNSGHPWSSANFEPPYQPPDLPAAVYAMKGKSKQLRRVSGSTRDVGNEAQSGLKPEVA